MSRHRLNWTIFFVDCNEILQTKQHNRGKNEFYFKKQKLIIRNTNNYFQRQHAWKNTTSDPTSGLLDDSLVLRHSLSLSHFISISFSILLSLPSLSSLSHSLLCTDHYVLCITNLNNKGRLDSDICCVFVYVFMYVFVCLGYISEMAQRTNMKFAQLNHLMIL